MMTMMAMPRQPPLIPLLYHRITYSFLYLFIYLVTHDESSELEFVVRDPQFLGSSCDFGHLISRSWKDIQVKWKWN